MSGILLPHPILRRGSITRSGRVRSRSGIITRHGETDPLEGIPFNLRLQTHRGEVRGVINDILVTGAGDASVNGLYQMDGYFDGRPSFTHTSGNISIIWFSGWLPEPVWLLNATNGPAYINLNNPDLPPEEGWQDAGGGGAMPVIRFITHQRLAPVGLYKDTACTTPATAAGDLIAAWRDEISGSGLVAVQDVSTKRPILRFASGVPVLEFDGVDDFLIATEVPTISGIISAAVTGMYGSSAQSNGRLLSMADTSSMDWEGGTGYVSAFRPLYGSQIGVQYAESLGHQEILPNEWFTFASRATGSAIETWKNGANKVTASVNTTAIAATRLKIGGSFAFSDTADLWGGYINNVTLGPWTEGQTLQVQDYFKDLFPDPLMGIPFSLRLQTHRGDGVPFGLYKDVACTIPAMEDGDSVAAWRDELSGSGLVLEQSIPAKRPTLQFVSGVPVLEFDGIDDFLIATGVPTISGIISATATGMYRSSAQDNGRLLSMADTSNMDWEGGTGYVPALRPLSDSEVGVQYAESHGYQSTLANEWFTFSSRATGSAIETWKNGTDKVTASVNTSAIASTRIKIGGSFAFSDTADLWDGYISSVAFGPWTEAQTLQTQFHFSKLRPS